MAERPSRRVLFVCVQNAGRSQMAAALFNRYSTASLRAESAGTRPARRVHPEVVAAMREVGIDLEGNTPQRMTPELAAGVDRVVTMGCGDECPHLRAKQRADWGIPDPKHLSPDEFRQVRGLIESKVQAALSRIGIDLCKTASQSH